MKKRMIDTKFWDDDYTANLDPIEKLLFLYFLTNTSTNICGIYEIPIKKVAMETGVDKEMVENVLKRFSKDKKIFYHKGWLCLKNFIKNQNQRSPKVKKGIYINLMAIPKDIIDKFIQYGYSMDTVSHSNSNSNSNSKDITAEAGTKKKMKKNSFNYNESKHSDSYEESVNLETGEIEKPQKASTNKKYLEMITWAESRRGFPFLAKVKQFTAFSLAKKNGIDPQRLKDRWIEFEGNDFWKEKGFDWMNVVTDFSKKK